MFKTLQIIVALASLCCVKGKLMHKCSNYWTSFDSGNAGDYVWCPKTAVKRWTGDQTRHNQKDHMIMCKLRSKTTACNRKQRKLTWNNDHILPHVARDTFPSPPSPLGWFCFFRAQPFPKWTGSRKEFKIFYAAISENPLSGGFSVIQQFSFRLCTLAHASPYFATFPILRKIIPIWKLSRLSESGAVCLFFRVQRILAVSDRKGTWLPRWRAVIR